MQVKTWKAPMTNCLAGQVGALIPIMVARIR
jgi:hypothetical protein